MALLWVVMKKTNGCAIAEAWGDLYYLERSAKVQIRAMSTGR